MNLKPRAQEAAWNKLVAMSEKLPQSLIALGPAGVGKKRAIKALFQYLHCEDGGGFFGTAGAEKPCGRCVQCVKIAENKHTDWIEIAPQGAQIVVDDLREMKKSLYFAPMDGNVRFVVIDQAHRLNLTSANSLLKTLEEPPAHTRFFLITHERSRLLPTIQSRSQFLNFAPLDNDTISTLLDEMQVVIPEKIKPMCLALMGGGMDRLESIRDEKVLIFLDQIANELDRLVARPSWDNVVMAADALGNDDQKIELLLDVLVWFERERAVSQAHSGDLNSARATSNRALSATFLRDRLERNANKKLVALAAADLISQAQSNS